MPLQLDDLAALDAPAPPAGVPLNLPIDHIDEDPEQPRREFDANALDELAQTIRERGVRQPISVRPSLQMPERWTLNFGARRLRASKLAGLTEIPAFIDTTADSYDQVIENEQREGLKPLELALFVQKRLAAGRQADRDRAAAGQEQAMGDAGHRADRSARLADADLSRGALPRHERTVRTAAAATASMGRPSKPGLRSRRRSRASAWWHCARPLRRRCGRRARRRLPSWTAMHRQAAESKTLRRRRGKPVARLHPSRACRSSSMARTTCWWSRWRRTNPAACMCVRCRAGRDAWPKSANSSCGGSSVPERACCPSDGQRAALPAVAFVASIGWTATATRRLR